MRRISEKAFSFGRGRSYVRTTGILAALCCSAVLMNCDSARAAEIKISGTVWTSERTAPPRATIKVQQGGKDVCETCKVTTETGKYELAVTLGRGKYTLTAYDNEGKWLEDSKVCKLDEDGSHKLNTDTTGCVLNKGSNDNVDFTLRKPAKRVAWGGTITNSAGDPLASVEVLFSIPGCEGCVVLRTKTDERGKYSASELAARIYERVVVFQGFSSRPKEIDVGAERAYQADLMIRQQGSQWFVSVPPPDRHRGFQMPDIATNIGRSIVGRFFDSNGAVLPGITVTVTREAGRSQSTTTDEYGAFRFFNLDPGSYTVEGEAMGFTKFIQTKVQISLSTASIVNAHVTPAGVTETVTVGDTGAVNIDTNTTGINVSSGQFANFPTQRTVQGLYTIAPTVSRSGLHDATGRDRDPSVAGSSGPENNYILDGMNTTDPAFGGSGANLPFEFVQEVEIKTGAYGAESGKSTGGIFNIVTKMGSNQFHGDLFGYGTTRGLVGSVKNFPFTGSAFANFSRGDLGGDLGGPIKKDKAWFFGGFNPQRRTNFCLIQTFHEPRENKVTIPYYAGKFMWALNNNNTFTASTVGDFTKIQGFLAGGTLTNASGFGSDREAFEGRQETGGYSYAFRLNSTIRNTFVAEFSGGLHLQRASTIPLSTAEQLVNDNFVVLKGATVLPVVQTGVNFGAGTGFIDFVDGRGGSLQRNFLRGPGFGLFSHQERNRYEINAHLQNIAGKHAIKWGIEWSRNIYNIDTRSTGPSVTYGNPLGLSFTNGADANQTHGARISNNFLVCTVRGTVINCPDDAGVLRVQAIPAATLASLGLMVNGAANPITVAEALNNPFLIRNTTRVRDFQQVGRTYTNMESFYVQDDYKFRTDWQFNIGARWDFQQAHSVGGTTSIGLNDFWDNLAPRLGLVWDFTGKGKGKIFVNYATFIEVPIPLEVNIRASGGALQTDKNFNVNRYSAPASATIVPGVGTGAVNLGSHATPIDPGLKPQSVSEGTAGIEYEVIRDLVLGARGTYRNMKNVIEDGSFDDGETFFIFNPGRNEPGTGERSACEGNPASARAPRCFGRAQRFYRALEFTATKRFTNNYQFIASYVFSSLIGNYEGLFRNDNRQADPNIVSLFDLTSLLDNTYGRLPNDRPHQFKFNGSYRTPFKLMIRGNFYMQSGTPFNQLVPHPVYGNNEGFAVQRGTAIVPTVTATQAGFPNVVNSIGSNRTPPTMNFDLGVYYPIKLGENKELRLTGDWFNVFNSQRAVILDQTFSINSGVTRVAPVTNPFWGAAVLVQPPSWLSLGAKFTF